tara:strand:+ start:924 stop:1103 length:180 start_codon:yes stop_codon:yes gene_type:complete
LVFVWLLIRLVLSEVEGLKNKTKKDPKALAKKGDSPKRPIQKKRILISIEIVKSEQKNG